MEAFLGENVHGYMQKMLRRCRWVGVFLSGVWGVEKE